MAEPAHDLRTRVQQTIDEWWTQDTPGPLDNDLEALTDRIMALYAQEFEKVREAWADLDLRDVSEN